MTNPSTNGGPLKRCPACKTDKPFSAFAKCKTRKDGHNGACRDCKSKRWAEHGRRYHRASRYGVTAEHVDAIAKAQGGVCAICKDPPKRGRPLCIDHNHTTGKVRGLLCDDCNTGIGLLRESRLILHASADYLTRYEEN